MAKKINHKELGEITLSQTRRARRVTLTVRPPGEVRLSFPPVVSQKEALKFAESRAEWVISQKEAYRKRYEVTLSEPFATRHHALEFNPNSGSEIVGRVRRGVVEVSYPQQMSHRDSRVQEVAKRSVEEAWRKEAKALLPQRVEQLAERHDFRYGKVTIRNNVSRWGSCSHQDNLSLSLHLMRLPDHLIDYILLHELCHTVHKNHGREFHSLLNEVTGGKHRQLHKELKHYSTRW